MRKPNLQTVDFQRRDFPADVVVETCCQCNLRCVMCPYPNLKRPKGFMAFETFKKVVDEIARVNPTSRLWVALLGEPLIRGDDLVRMLRYARAQGLENIHVNTNATYLTEEMTGKLLDSDFKELLISLDADTKETYDAIRVGGDFAAVVRNAEYFLAERKRRGLARPNVVTQFIVMDRNEREVEDFKRHWLAHGAVVKVRLKMGWGNTFRAEDLEAAGIKRDFPCPWILRALAVQWDGRFVFCDADYEGATSPGNVGDFTIKQIWDGEHAKRRERHWALDFSQQPCSSCKDWSVGRAQFFNPEPTDVATHV